MTPKPTNDTGKSIPSRKDEPLNTITKPAVQLPQKELPMKIISDKQRHSGSIFPPHDSDPPCKKTDLEINANIVVGKLKENTQGSSTLPSQNDTNNISNGKRAPINKTGITNNDSLQLKQPSHPPPDTPYFIPDPSNPDNWLGPMIKAELDLFRESRCKPADMVDEAIFDPASGLYYFCQNKCHNNRTALSLAIYYSMTGTTYCYDKQLKQFFFLCLTYCPSNTMYVISNEPGIPHYVSNTIGIPYPPVLSLTQAADIPPSLKRSSVNSSDVQTTLPTWPDQNYTPDVRWYNPTFTTFNPGNVENTTAQPHLELSKLTKPRSRSPQLNVPIKHHNGNDKSKPNGMNNLLL